MSSDKLDMMYNFVQSKLKTVTSTLDLLPYINGLMTFNNLKIQLSMALHQLYAELKDETNCNHRKHSSQTDRNYSTIQSLFFQLQRFNDVKNELSLNSPRKYMNKKSLLMSRQKPMNNVNINNLSSPIFQDIIIDKHCQSSISCIALHRIIKALLYYDNILSKEDDEGHNKGNINNKMQKNNNWIKYFNDKNYKHLLNDYHHILTHHLNQKNINATKHEFELIYNQITKHIKPCDVTKCSNFTRNRRIRENDKIEILNCCNNGHCNFYVETLDSIHCYFLHSYDIGMRVKTNQLLISCDDSKYEEGHKKQKKLKVDDNQFYTDKQLSKLKKILNQKLLPLKRQYVIKGGLNKYFSNMNDEPEPTLPRTLAPLCKNVFNDHKQRKFETIVNEIIPHLQTPILAVIKWLKQYIIDEEFIDEEAIRLDLDDDEYSDIRNSMQAHFKWSDDVTILIHHILREDIFNDNRHNDRGPNIHHRERSKSTFSTSTSYDFGHKFYYWDEYKENNQQDYGPNIGYKKKDWYIMKKYVNLKDEVINNKIYRLDMNRYNNIIKKAEMNISSTLCRNYKSADSLSSEYYKIKANSPVIIENLMSLILYCDYVDLAFAFRRTFRPISDQETNEQLKNRHREYWNMSKILSETVELFGDSISNSNNEVFYYGVSFLLSFPNFISHFCGPTSTTSYLEVSTIFSDDNAIILELVAENEYSNLKCFDCSWLSSYGHENEILFFGGYRPLKFKSIRLMQPSQNYQLFIKALTLFNHVVKAKRLPFELRDSITKIDYKIIKSLMRHYMTTVQYKNRSPNYINNLFKSFCDSKKYVHINIAWMNKQYPGFKKYLMCSIENNERTNSHDDDKKKSKSRPNLLFSSANSLIDVDYDNMISFEIIGALFPYCQEIIVWETGKITRNYVKKLIEQLKILNDQHRSMLRVIKLCDVRYNNKLLNKEFEREYGLKFDNDAFCRIHVDIKVRLQHENKHNNLFKEIPEYSHLIITRQYKKYKASLKRELSQNGNMMKNINGLNSIDISNGHKHRHKSRRKRNKQRSRSYHRNKYNKKRNSSLGPIYSASNKQLTAV